VRTGGAAAVLMLSMSVFGACAIRDPALTATGPVEQAPGAVEASAPSALRAATSADVNGLEMYYEIHGDGEPLVLLHGAYTGIDVSFGQLIPILAEDRMVIAVEQQGHGHTPDADRPLSYERMADDTATLLRQLDITRADFFGYSIGANIALQIGIRHPEIVRKIAVASAYYDPAGLYPGVLDGIAATTPETFEGSGLEEAYAAVAPDPGAWPVLIEKVKELDLSFKGWSPESIAAIKSPTLVVLGDSDIVDTAHAVRMFELLGGGVPGDFAGLPDTRLAVLPATTHIGVLAERSELVATLLRDFLAAPVAADR
jgi:pimeloyl-ACP methyl ester carboxylesterase